MKPYISCSLTPTAKAALLWIFRLCLIGAVGYFLVTPPDSHDPQVDQLTSVEDALQEPEPSPTASTTPAPTCKPSPALDEVEKAQRLWDKL